MKIYNKIVIDMATGEVIYEDSFFYDGPVLMCGGGNGGGQSYDPAYNAGMLELSKEQQAWAGEMFNQYKYGVPYDPNEMVQDTGAARIINPEWEAWNKGLGEEEKLDPRSGQPLPRTGQRENFGPEPEKYIGDKSKLVTRGSLENYDPNANTSEMEYNQNLVNANQGLLGQRTELEGAQMSDAMTAIKERAPVRSKFFGEAFGGIDIGERMDEAQADVEHGFKLSGESARREAMSYGVMDPNKIASISSGMNLEKAKSIAGARTAAKTTGEDEQFDRLRSAMAVI